MKELFVGFFGLRGCHRRIYGQFCWSQAIHQSVYNFSKNHWYVLLEPTFDPGENGSDFVWLDLWGSDEDKASDMNIWQATNLPEKADEMVTCNEFSNNASVIR